MTGAELDRERPAKLLGLLGSAHDDEIAAAGRAADRLVRQAGVRWPDMILPELTGPTRQRENEMVSDALTCALDRTHMLTDWEVKFCASLMFNKSRRGPISERQHEILSQIVDKCRIAEARAA